MPLFYTCEVIFLFTHFHFFLECVRIQTWLNKSIFSSVFPKKTRAYHWKLHFYSFFFFLYTKFEGVLSTFLRQENEELKEDKSYTTGNTCHSKTYNNMFTDLRGHP